MSEQQKKNYKWYIIQCVSNYEDKVKQALENKRQSEGLSEDINQVFLPKAEKISKAGRKNIKPLFPGYIFIEMVMTDNAWFIIRNTQDVTGIVGSSGQRTKPTPIPQSSIDKMIAKIKDAPEAEAVKEDTEFKIQDLRVGQKIKIIKGPFENQIVEIDSITTEEMSVKVHLEAFGKIVSATLPLHYIGKVGLK